MQPLHRDVGFIAVVGVNSELALKVLALFDAFLYVFFNLEVLFKFNLPFAALFVLLTLLVLLAFGLLDKRDATLSRLLLLSERTVRTV